MSDQECIIDNKEILYQAMRNLIVSVLFCCPLSLGGSDTVDRMAVGWMAAERVEADCSQAYEDMGLEACMDWRAFRQAYEGYRQIEHRKEVLTLIDYSKPSTEERLFVMDMAEHKLLFCSVVAHGRNSGNVYATSFSNEEGSYKSSLGFYRTESAYRGRNGYSLVLEGLEEGINDAARRRAIVVHGAAYAHPSVAERSGRLGRSLGCPAVPEALSRPIIDAIKEGSVVYIYADDPDYKTRSRFFCCISEK